MPLLKCLAHKDGLLKSNFKLVRQEYMEYVEHVHQQLSFKSFDSQGFQHETCN